MTLGRPANLLIKCELDDAAAHCRRGRYSSNAAAGENEEEDELDLFPGGLELPPMRSPRGSLHSLYGSNSSSRRDSNCSVGSNSRRVTIVSLGL